MTKRTLQRIVGAAAAVVLLGAIGFAIGRELGGGDEAPPAVAASTPTPVTPAATPTPGATATPAAPEVDPYTGLSLNPDTPQPFWAIPYRDKDRELPRFDGVIAGLRIGPGADAGVDDLPSECSKTRWGKLEEARGTPLELPLVLPNASVQGRRVQPGDHLRG